MRLTQARTLGIQIRGDRKPSMAWNVRREPSIAVGVNIRPFMCK